MKKTRQRELLAALDALAAPPFQTPALTSQDGDGFEIAILYAVSCMVSYHVVHAARLVQIRETTPIS